MNSKLRQALFALGHTPERSRANLDAGLWQLSDWMDAQHTVLLHSIVEHTPEQNLALAVRQGEVSAGSQALSLCSKRLAWLREEVSLKFGEFRDKWRQRLDEAMLLPFLRKNGWLQSVEGGFQLSSRGGRKEAKMLYLQTLHDMSADCERQIASAGGHIARIQSDVAAAWHAESIRDNASRLLPALEAVLRQGEADAFKRLRLNLGDLALENFLSKTSKMEVRPFASESELFHSLSSAWHRPPLTQNGFEGFMLLFADLSEALCQAMLDHYQAKWELFLRGLAPDSPLTSSPAIALGDSAIATHSATRSDAPWSEATPSLVSQEP